LKEKKPAARLYSSLVGFLEKIFLFLELEHNGYKFRLRCRCKLMPSIKELAHWLSEARRIVIVGVGNPLRRDDNIGVEVVSELEGKVPKQVLLIKSETVPESFFEPIVEFKPTHILILDAALLNLSPGSIRLIEPKEATGTALSTHALPIQIFCEYLAKTTGAKITMLLIQPADTSFGEGLTRKLNLTKKRLVNHLISLIGGAKS
jgi:hydrogenase 3 maturation protease